jgi:hypothetical protein
MAPSSINFCRKPSTGPRATLPCNRACRGLFSVWAERTVSTGKREHPRGMQSWAPMASSRTNHELCHPLLNGLNAIVGTNSLLECKRLTKNVHRTSCTSCAQQGGSCCHCGPQHTRLDCTPSANQIQQRCDGTTRVHQVKQQHQQS